MKLSQLHAYLGKLLQAGTPGTLPVVLPGLRGDAYLQEVSEAMLVEGVYEADPAPLARGSYQLNESCLMLAGTLFDMDTLADSHTLKWPLVEPPSPDRTFPTS